MTNSYSIVGANVLDIQTGDYASKSIRIEGQRIFSVEAVNPKSYTDPGQRVDATGLYAIPGLCDMHIHLTVWPEYVEKIGRSLIANGITGVRDMGGPLEQIKTLKEYSRTPNSVSPHIWMAGPIIDGVPKLLEPKPDSEMPDIAVGVATEQEAIALVDTLCHHGADFVKLYEMLTPEVFKALVLRAQSHGLPAAGHTPGLMEISEILSIAPYDIQHIVGGNCGGLIFECSSDPFGIMEKKRSLFADPTVNKTAESIYAAIIETAALAPSDMSDTRRSEFIDLFVKAQTWHTPTLCTMAGHVNLGFTDDVRRRHAISFLPKSIQEKFDTFDTHDNNRHRSIWAEWYMETVYLMYKGGVQFLAGTDCPPVPDFAPGSALHFEIESMVQAGVSPLAALQAATINGAKFFNATDDHGAISRGKVADIVLLTGDPLKNIRNTQNIEAVVSRGRYYDRTELNELIRK